MFFSSNVDGWGMWELQFPVAITNTCYNSMVTPQTTAVQLKRVSSSQVAATSNDGFYCRQKQILSIGATKWTKATTESSKLSSTNQPDKTIEEQIQRKLSGVRGIPDTYFAQGPTVIDECFDSAQVS